MKALEMQLDATRTLRVEHTPEGFVRVVVDRADLLGAVTESVMAYTSVSQFCEAVFSRRGAADDDDDEADDTGAVVGGGA